MITTLQRYLARDLIKTALLAVVAFTLVMTTFAIIEPLRKEGLSPGQAMRFFWYTIPVMLSLTLPIAALFSATIVYGRFSMANELTACRASGVSTFALLRPVWVMGIIVTLLTLAMSNWVAPRLTQRLEQVGKANLRSLVYQQLKAKAYWKIGSIIIHATQSDPDNDVLRGVVAIDLKSPDDVRFAAASAAYVNFIDDQVVITPVAPILGRQQSFSMYTETGQHTVGPIELPSLTRETPAFYDWKTLGDILERPENSSSVQKRLTNIKRELLSTQLYQDMAESLSQGQSYELAGRSGGRFVFRAPRARVERGRRLLLLSGQREADPPAVVVEAYDAGGALRWIFTAQQGIVTANYEPSIRETQVGVDLSDVQVNTSLNDHDPQAPRHRGYHLGPLAMPVGMEERLEGVERDLYLYPERFPSVSGSLNEMTNFIKRLNRKIKAEIHGRIGYGIGCFFLVSLGAALGLVFRGGQILSAFAISCIPAMILIILTIMGRQLMGNPGVQEVWGIAAIWGALVILAGMLAYVYGFLLRR